MSPAVNPSNSVSSGSRADAGPPSSPDSSIHGRHTSVSVETFEEKSSQDKLSFSEVRGVVATPATELSHTFDALHLSSPLSGPISSTGQLENLKCFSSFTSMPQASYLEPISCSSSASSSASSAATSSRPDDTFARPMRVERHLNAASNSSATSVTAALASSTLVGSHSYSHTSQSLIGLSGFQSLSPSLSPQVYPPPSHSTSPFLEKSLQRVSGQNQGQAGNNSITGTNLFGSSQSPGVKPTSFPTSLSHFHATSPLVSPSLPGPFGSTSRSNAGAFGTLFHSRPSAISNARNSSRGKITPSLGANGLDLDANSKSQPFRNTSVEDAPLFTLGLHPTSSRSNTPFWLHSTLKPVVPAPNSAFGTPMGSSQAPESLSRYERNKTNADALFIHGLMCKAFLKTFKNISQMTVHESLMSINSPDNMLMSLMRLQVDKYLQGDTLSSEYSGSSEDSLASADLSGIPSAISLHFLFYAYSIVVLVESKSHPQTQHVPAYKKPSPSPRGSLSGLNSALFLSASSSPSLSSAQPPQPLVGLSASLSHSLSHLPHLSGLSSLSGVPSATQNHSLNGSNSASTSHSRSTSQTPSRSPSPLLFASSGDQYTGNRAPTNTPFNPHSSISTGFDMTSLSDSYLNSAYPIILEQVKLELARHQPPNSSSHQPLKAFSQSPLSATSPLSSSAGLNTVTGSISSESCPSLDQNDPLYRLSSGTDHQLNMKLNSGVDIGSRSFEELNCLVPSTSSAPSPKRVARERCSSQVEVVLSKPCGPSGRAQLLSDHAESHKDLVPLVQSLHANHETHSINKSNSSEEDCGEDKENNSLSAFNPSSLAATTKAVPSQISDKNDLSLLSSNIDDRSRRHQTNELGRPVDELSYSHTPFSSQTPHMHSPMPSPGTTEISYVSTTRSSKSLTVDGFPKELLQSKSRGGLLTSSLSLPLPLPSPPSSTTSSGSSSIPSASSSSQF